MKHLFFIFALFITFICQGQTYNELKANRVIALKNLRLPDTITGLKLSDSGSIAIKGTYLWIWNGTSWNNTQVVIDTTILSTKANTQKVVDDTSKVLRELIANKTDTAQGITGSVQFKGSNSKFQGISLFVYDSLKSKLLVDSLSTRRISFGSPQPNHTDQTNLDIYGNGVRKWIFGSDGLFYSLNTIQPPTGDFTGQEYLSPHNWGGNAISIYSKGLLKVNQNYTHAGAERIFGSASTFIGGFDVGVTDTSYIDLGSNPSDRRWSTINMNTFYDYGDYKRIYGTVYGLSNGLQTGAYGRTDKYVDLMVGGLEYIFPHRFDSRVGLEIRPMRDALTYLGATARDTLLPVAYGVYQMGSLDDNYFAGRTTFADTLKALLALNSSDSSTNVPNTAWIKQRIAGLSGGSGISDGDKGDITVSGSGATWTVDNSAITYAKIQDAGANTIIGRDAGTSGILAEISTTRFPLFGSAITGTPSASTYLRGDGTWATPAGGGTSLSGLTAATGANDIDNGNNVQTWRWNSLTPIGAYGIKFLSSSTSRTSSGVGGIVQIQSTGANANASVTVRGIDVNVQNTGTTNQNFGGYFQASGGATVNVGVYGYGESSGLQGQTISGNGVYGYASGGAGRGGNFLAVGTTGSNYGIDASATGSGATNNYGVRGVASGASSNYGVYGSGTTYGVYGTSNTANGIGVSGNVTATTGTNNYGIQGTATGSGANTNYGGYFSSSSATTNYGVYGTASTYGVYGSGSGSGAAGVFGINNTNSGTAYGVRGVTQGSGATTGYAFHAIASNATTNYAFYAQSGITKINSLEVAYTFHTSPTLTVDATHYFISADATTNNITINLPTASGIAGRVYIVKKIDASGNTVTIDPNGSETIDGASTNVLSTQYEYHMFVSNGANWLIIGG